jgi:hypothetical protein
MSKLTDAIAFHTVVRARKDKDDYANRYRAKCEWFAEMTVMRPVEKEQERHINKNLRETICHHLEDLAYAELHDHILKLERKVRSSMAYDADVVDTFNDIYSIIRS